MVRSDEANAGELDSGVPVHTGVRLEEVVADACSGPIAVVWTSSEALAS